MALALSDRPPGGARSAPPGPAATHPTLHNLRENLLKDLVNKVGLSEDTAQKVRDFSLTEVFDAFRKEFTDENGKPDLAKVLSKINLGDIQGKAQEMLGGLGAELGKLFGKK